MTVSDALIAEVLWVSVVRACNDLIENIKGEGGYPATLEFIDWEAVGEEKELRDVDLLGPSTLGFIEESPDMFSVSFAVGVSTHGETENLFRQRKLVALVFERFRVRQQINLLHPATGDYLGVMTIVDGSALSPVERTELRPYQSIQVQALLQTAEADTASA